MTADRQQNVPTNKHMRGLLQGTQNNWDSDLIRLSSSEQRLDVMKLQWQGLVAIAQHRLVLQHEAHHSTVYANDILQYYTHWTTIPWVNCPFTDMPSQWALHCTGTDHFAMTTVKLFQLSVAQHSVSAGAPWICNVLPNKAISVDLLSSFC